MSQNRQNDEHDLRRVIREEIQRQVRSGMVQVPLDVTVHDVRLNLDEMVVAVANGMANADRPDVLPHNPWDVNARCDESTEHPKTKTKIYCQLDPGHDSDHCWLGDGTPEHAPGNCPYRWPREKS